MANKRTFIRQYTPEERKAHFWVMGVANTRRETLMALAKKLTTLQQKLDAAKSAPKRDERKIAKLTTICSNIEHTLNAAKTR